MVILVNIWETVVWAAEDPDLSTLRFVKASLHQVHFRWFLSSWSRRVCGSLPFLTRKRLILLVRRTKRPERDLLFCLLAASIYAFWSVERFSPVSGHLYWHLRNYFQVGLMLTCLYYCCVLLLASKFGYKCMIHTVGKYDKWQIKTLKTKLK